MSAKTRIAVLCSAFVLLAGALIWGAYLEKDDPLSSLARKLNEYGFSLSGEDFYLLGAAQDATVADLIADGTELSAATEASVSSGFPSNVDARGEITVLLANTERGVLTVYLRDGECELCFLQTGDGGVIPLK